ncbi:cytochrome P450 [Dendrothele bispora CBS 962.96]|uniref:Cytochrome P450 n=1 Tax=Dendrothele bispora (strain CBS 962.96) TaxID=1314807 RepID=A0A4S8M732_DENBC|nr:cytochrome P450 [Dendrothele bispora CBS 962.96]
MDDFLKFSQEHHPLLSFAIALSSIWFLRAVWRLWSPKGPNAPVYGPWYLPSFIRGMIAMVKLGSDEDAFLLDCLNTYGPIVYIPWPMAQYFVMTSSAINRVYATPQKTLSFLPIRMGMQASVFGTNHDVAHGSFMTTQAFPAHAKGMATLRLDEPIQRFIQVARGQVEKLKQRVVSSPNGEVTIDLAQWIGEVMFDAGLCAMFGPEVVKRSEDLLPSHKYSLKSGHYIFDDSFPLLASDMIPKSLHRFVEPVREGVRGREAVSKVLAKWVAEGLPGLEKGLIKDVTQVYLDCGVSVEEVGTLLLSDLWALQANAPQAAGALFTRVLQSPHIVKRLLEEIDNAGLLNTEKALTLKSVNEKLELGASCIQETLRLETSAFSIRIAQTDFMFDVSDENVKGDGSSSAVFIPKDARVVAATRAAHLTDGLWGKDPEEWDGERFLLEGEREEDRVRLKAKMYKEMRGFGGGVSMCEGRYFASAELKVLLALIIPTFDMQVIKPEEDKLGNYKPIKLKGVPFGEAFAPKKQDSRPGLGAFQFARGSDVAVKVRLRE